MNILESLGNMHNFYCFFIYDWDAEKYQWRSRYELKQELVKKASLSQVDSSF